MDPYKDLSDAEAIQRSIGVIGGHVARGTLSGRSTLVLWIQRRVSLTALTGPGRLLQEELEAQRHMDRALSPYPELRLTQLPSAAAEEEVPQRVAVYGPC